MNTEAKPQLTRRRAVGGLIAAMASSKAVLQSVSACAQGTSAQSTNGSLLLVDDFRLPKDGLDWAPAFNRALRQASSQRMNVAVAATSAGLPLLSIVEIWPDATGWTPVIFGNKNRFILGNVAAGFRYRGRKDGAVENPLTGGMQDFLIDHDNLGDPAVNSGTRGVFISNGGGSLTFGGVRGANMRFGFHIQNWRYADGGRPGGGIITRHCDCSGTRSDDRSHKWYPFADQGDLSVEMPGDTVAPGETAVVATPQDAVTSYGTKSPARALFWANHSPMPIRIPHDLSASSLKASGLTQGGASGTLHGQTLAAVTYAYWISGGARKPSCVVEAETGRIDGADHDGGYYGTMLEGTREYFVNHYHSRNNVRGIAGQNGAKNVQLSDVKISQSLSSAILAGYNTPGWIIDDFLIEATNDRWVGEALINIQLGAPGVRIRRGRIVMGDDQRTGQYAVKFGPNSPGCRIEGPLTIIGDCAKAYIAVESAWDESLSKKAIESYPRADYRGIASIPMTGVQLRNIRIEANSKKPQVPAAIAIIQASDGDRVQGFHGQIPVSDLLIENVTITSPKHSAYVKFIAAETPSNARVSGVILRNVRTPTGQSKGNAKFVFPSGNNTFRCLQGVSGIPDRCP